MNSTDIIGYKADADAWCPECAVTEYGGANRNIILVNGVPGFIETPLDTEGNEVYPMFCGEETDTPICCCRCMEPIETTVLDPEGRYTEPDHAPDHDPSECRDCDQRAHADGMGCWCPVCICPNAPGGNDSSDGVECAYCVVTTEPVTRYDVWRRKDDSMDALMDDLEDGAYRTINAIMSAIAFTVTEWDGNDKLPILTDGQRSAVWDAVAAVSRPVVNAIDVADMIGPGVTISELEEGIDEHTFLHLGRPGECGNGCPAYVTMPQPETVVVEPLPNCGSCGKPIFYSQDIISCNYCGSTIHGHCDDGGAGQCSNHDQCKETFDAAMKLEQETPKQESKQRHIASDVTNP